MKQDMDGITIREVDVMRSPVGQPVPDALFVIRQGKCEWHTVCRLTEDTLVIDLPGIEKIVLQLPRNMCIRR